MQRGAARGHLEAKGGNQIAELFARDFAGAIRVNQVEDLAKFLHLFLHTASGQPRGLEGSSLLTELNPLSASAIFGLAKIKDTPDCHGFERLMSQSKF